jgi:V8-like Glu-specific endopeptidase
VRRALIASASLIASIWGARSDPPFRYLDASAPAAHFSLVVKTPGHLCTGVLVAPDVVVTAAHCLLQLRLAPDEIRLIFADALPRGRGANSGFHCRGEKFAVNPLWGTLQLPAAQPAFDMAAIKFSCKIPPGFQPIDIDFAKIEQLIAQHSSGGAATDIALSVVGYGNMTAPDTRPGDKR